MKATKLASAMSILTLVLFQKPLGVVLFLVIAGVNLIVGVMSVLVQEWHAALLHLFCALGTAFWAANALCLLALFRAQTKRVAMQPDVEMERLLAKVVSRAMDWNPSRSAEMPDELFDAVGAVLAHHYGEPYKTFHMAFRSRKDDTRRTANS